MTRAALVLCTVVLALAGAAGCGEDTAGEGNDTEVVGQGGGTLSAVDTATVERANQQVELVCTQGRKEAENLESSVRAAAAVARREPNKTFRSGNSESTEPIVDVVGDMAKSLRRCGHKQLATDLLSRPDKSDKSDKDDKDDDGGTGGAPGY